MINRRKSNSCIKCSGSPLITRLPLLFVVRRNLGEGMAIMR